MVHGFQSHSSDEESLKGEFSQSQHHSMSEECAKEERMHPTSPQLDGRYLLTSWLKLKAMKARTKAETTPYMPASTAMTKTPLERGVIDTDSRIPKTGRTEDRRGRGKVAEERG